MHIENSTNDMDDPIRPKSVVPPQNYGTRAIRLRLLSLFGMLILVIVLMKEAGKPERWEWMGFEKTQKIELEEDNLAARSQDDFDLSPEKPDDVAVPLDTPISLGDNVASPSPREFAGLSESQFRSNVAFPASAVAFWEPLFRKMNSQQRQTLLQLLKSMRQGSPIGSNQMETASALVETLQRQRQDFHQRLLDQLAVTPNGSTEKKRIANDLYESQELWDKKVFPAMSAAARGEDITISQQQTILGLQEVIDPLLLQLVQDRTSIGWTGDSAAWKRLWEKSLSQLPAEFEAVSRIQLMSQPDFYRGQPITVAGWVRSARREVLSGDSELGIPGYYILWIRPKESKLGPYCVYTHTLPEGFPPISDQFSDVNEHVQVSGYFFKVRTYVAGDASVQNCPVIIAQAMEPIEAVSFTSVNRWKPTRTTLVVLLALIPVIATCLAWWAFRTSETRRYTPGLGTQKRINDSLDELAGDPRVQTDREKIMSLYETDGQDG